MPDARTPVHQPQGAAHAPSGTLNDLTVAPGYETWLTKHGLDSLDALFNAASGDSLAKPGLEPWRERLRLVLDDGPEPSVVYLKRYAHPPSVALKHVRRSGSGAASLAGVEWAWMRRLRSDHIPCPEPIAFGESLDGRREARSAILVAAAPGRSLESWVVNDPIDDPEQSRRLYLAVADLIGRFHQAGYIHRDLYLSHVFADAQSPTHLTLTLIDLQRVMRPSAGRMRWIVKDLAALNYSTPGAIMSRSDRLRWLKRYLAVSKLEVSLPCLAYRVLGKTQAIAQHDRRRQARLRRVVDVRGKAVYR